jgi:hypothetical protein
MDPSRNICVVRDSFNSSLPTGSKNLKYEKIVYSEPPVLSIQSPRTRRHKLLDISSQSLQKSAQIEFSKEISIVEEEILDLNIKSEVFDRADIILANIDAIYNFSGQEDGYLKPQIIKEYDFVNLSDTANYLTYLQYRLPFARGFLSTCEHTFVNKPYIEERNLNIGCYSLKNNNHKDENIINYVLDIVPEGVDLVVSDNINYKNNLLAALKLCKPGGTFICKIDDSTVDISLKYLTALLFETFSLFKPLAENLNNSYSYIIASNYKGNSNEWIGLIEKNIFVPPTFINFVKNYYISLNDLRKNLSENPVVYDTYKCKAVWNIF